MQKFKHLAVSTPLAWTHDTHECTHAYITAVQLLLGLSQAPMRSFAEFGTFTFVCLQEKKKCIWESASHKLLYTQPDIFRMSSPRTVNRMSDGSFSC